MLLAATALALVAGHGDRSIHDAIERAKASAPPVLTPADRTAIDARCGYRAGERGRSTRFENGALYCDDGRRFDDAETRAIAGRIEVRARAYADHVTNSPDVRAVIDGTVQRRTAEALRRAAAAMNR